VGSSGAVLADFFFPARARAQKIDDLTPTFNIEFGVGCGEGIWSWAGFADASETRGRQITRNFVANFFPSTVQEFTKQAQKVFVYGPCLVRKR